MPAARPTAPSPILQVDAKIALSFPLLHALSFLLCRDASQPQNSTEIPPQLQPQKREPANGLGFGRQRALGYQRGAGVGGGESGGHSAREWRGALASVGWRAGDPRKKLSRVIWHRAALGLGPGGEWLLHLGLSHQPRFGGGAGLSWGGWMLPPPAGSGLGGAAQNGLQSPRAGRCSAFYSEGTAHRAGQGGGSWSGLVLVTTFSGHPPELGTLGSGRGREGVQAVWLLRIPRNIYYPQGSLPPKAGSERGRRSPVICSGPRRGSRSG